MTSWNTLQGSSNENYSGTPWPLIRLCQSTLFCLRFPPFVMNILPCFSGFSLRNNRSRAQGFSAAQQDPDFLAPISGVWWVRCLWRPTATSKSRVNSNVSAKFFDTMHIIHAFFSFIVLQLNTFCVLWIPRNCSAGAERFSGCFHPTPILKIE